MKPIRIPSHVGGDGVLHLDVPLGSASANSPVVVTIHPLKDNGKHAGHPTPEWLAHVNRTYGSCAGLDLARHQQGALENREPVQ